ncbi:MAG: hypothetical protein OJF58_005368 [Enhydrobacter sp.]|nr:MAG: hypothetical protein OJF58_005368 [Enhydrobacter sp.]
MAGSNPVVGEIPLHPFRCHPERSEGSFAVPIKDPSLRSG